MVNLVLQAVVFWKWFNQRYFKQ